MRKLLLLFLMPLLVFTACGEKSPEDSLQSSAETLIQASLDRDWPTFCDSLNKESQKNLIALLNVSKGSTCAEALSQREAVVGDRVEEQAKDNKLGKVEIDGSKGAVVVDTPRGEQIFPAVLENGQWKLNLFPAAK